MSFADIKLPSGLTPEVKAKFDAIRPFLVDVHTMLRLPALDNEGAIKEGFEGGCNFAAAMTLLAVVEGVAQELYIEPRKRGRGKNSNFQGSRSEQLLADRYPWSLEPNSQDRIEGAEAATVLWEQTRNPLAHNLGYNSMGDIVIAKSGAGGRNGGLATEDLAQIETSNAWPFGEKPTLRKYKGLRRYKLTVKCFYWGVRQLISTVAQDNVDFPQHSQPAAIGNQAATSIGLGKKIEPGST